jgi:hypothetical protein
MSEESLKEKAERCRRLAENTLDERAARSLREMATEYEARHRLETGRGHDDSDTQSSGH